MTRRSRLVLGVAAIYGAALALIAAWPTHVDEHVLDNSRTGRVAGHDISSGRTYWLIESAANVVLFVPFGVLLMLLWRRATSLRVTAAALVASCGIEILQAVALPGRTASAQDVVTNVLGAAIGAFGVTIWRASARRRAPKV